MERWSGKIAVVTGASSGIGAAITLDLVRAGLTVVGLARRAERVEQLRAQLPAHLAGALHAHKCDVSQETDILAAFAWIRETLGGCDILVNNAGTSAHCRLVEPGNTARLRETLDVNVVGLVQCTREAFQSMRERGVDGHVVLINSICGHALPMLPGVPSLHMYGASKYAVTAIAETLRQEFIGEGTRTKVTVRV